MKLFIQLILLVLIILIVFFLYIKYFDQSLNLEQKSEQKIYTEQTNQDNFVDTNNNINVNKKIVQKNNKIKNLSYEINLYNQKKYIINADASELIYENNKEIVYMKNVVATLIDKNNQSLIIKSDEAVYNSFDNNTKFKNNIKIVYLDNIILSGRADLNLLENYILIYENVIYQNPRGSINTDNMRFDLVTKNVFMFMNNNQNKVQIIAN